MATLGNDVAPTPPTELIALMFEAVEDADLWPHVVGSVTEWVGGRVGGLQVRHLGPKVSASVVTSGLDPDFARSYGEHYFSVDPHLARVGSLVEGATMLSREVIADAQLARSEYHQEWVRPQRLSDLQGAMLLKNDRRIVTYATWSDAGQRFDEQTRARLDCLVPHLTRAVRLSLDFEDLRTTASAALTVTDGCVRALLSVDAHLRVLRVVPREAEERVMRSDFPVRLCGNQLVVRCAEQRAELDAAMRRALGGSSATCVLVGPAGLCNVLAVPRARQFPLRPSGVVDLILTWMQNLPATGFELLPQALQKVALCLQRGMSDKEVAVQLGVTHATARTYVTRVLRACGFSSRRDFMRGR